MERTASLVSPKDTQPHGSENLTLFGSLSASSFFRLSGSHSATFH